MEPNTILCGRAEDVLRTLPASSVDLVATSPPYAMQRKNLYLGISETDYPAWTVNWLNACIPALKKHASAAIVIRPHVHRGQISDYVLRTRLALREAGWFECDEFIWVKSNSPPIGHTGRPRRAWESILWFSRVCQPFCDPKANGQHSRRIGMKSRKGRQKYIDGADLPEDWHEVEGISRSRDYVEVGTAECDYSKQNSHPAQFPVRMIQWVIEMLCPPGGTVLDPFMGSGTTAVACQRTGRHYYGIDVCEEYCNIARARLASLQI